MIPAFPALPVPLTPAHPAAEPAPASGVDPAAFTLAVDGAGETSGLTDLWGGPLPLEFGLPGVSVSQASSRALPMDADAGRIPGVSLSATHLSDTAPAGVAMRSDVPPDDAVAAQVATPPQGSASPQPAPQTGDAQPRPLPASAPAGHSDAQTVEILQAAPPNQPRTSAGSSESALLMRAAAMPATDPAFGANPPEPEMPEPAAPEVAIPGPDHPVTLTAVPDDGPPLATQPADPIRLGPTAPIAPALPAPTLPDMVQTILSAQSDTVDLVLTPEDLGRLRFEVSQSGDQMKIVLSVERPETLDLLRRHAEQVLEELRQAGFDGATLSFGPWERGGQQQDPDRRPDAPPAPMQDEPALPLMPAAPGSGLDLRL